ncbi:MAG: hypothetical protein H6R46_634 [Proteobacteria bacterium]|nr:hypothetical protein [Pseudomonadota bacterium]
MTRYYQGHTDFRSNAMHRQILLVMLLVPSIALAAEPIYKSVDEQGSVTYSAQPPATGVKSETIAVPPPPSEEDVRRAEEQASKVKAQADELEKERKSREAEQAAAAAAAPPAGSTVVIPVVPGVVGEPGVVPVVPVRPAPLPAHPIRR